MPAAGRPGQFVAVTLAIWNPYVAERLLQGHWSLLVGYGCLPWVATAVLRMRAGDGGIWPVVFWIAFAGLTPTGLLLAATVALVSTFAAGHGRPRWACVALSLGVALLSALPWLVASALAGSLSSTQAAGVPVFAARAEPGLGTLGSLAGLGGIWNAQAVPDSRTTLFAMVGTFVAAGDRRPWTADGTASARGGATAGAGRGRRGRARGHGDGAGSRRTRGAGAHDARARGASRRTEVGGPRAARIRAGRRRCRRDRAGPDARRGSGGTVLCGAARRAARPGLGGGRARSPRTVTRRAGRRWRP